MLYHVCVCVRVCVYVYIIVYVCVSVCACVCMCVFWGSGLCLRFILLLQAERGSDAIHADVITDSLKI